MKKLAVTETVYPLVWVEWIDAGSWAHWSSPRDIPRAPRAKTLGFLVREDKESISVAASIGETGDGSWDANAVMVIPLGCITARYELDFPDA